MHCLRKCTECHLYAYVAGDICTNPDCVPASVSSRRKNYVCQSSGHSWCGMIVSGARCELAVRSDPPRCAPTQPAPPFEHPQNTPSYVHSNVVSPTAYTSGLLFGFGPTCLASQVGPQIFGLACLAPHGTLRCYHTWLPTHVWPQDSLSWPPEDSCSFRTEANLPPKLGLKGRSHCSCRGMREHTNKILLESDPCLARSFLRLSFTYLPLLSHMHRVRDLVRILRESIWL